MQNPTSWERWEEIAEDYLRLGAACITEAQNLNFLLTDECIEKCTEAIGFINISMIFSNDYLSEKWNALAHAKEFMAEAYSFKNDYQNKIQMKKEAIHCFEQAATLSNNADDYLMLGAYRAFNASDMPKPEERRDVLEKALDDFKKAEKLGNKEASAHVYQIQQELESM